MTSEKGRLNPEYHEGILASRNNSKESFSGR